MDASQFQTRAMDRLGESPSDRQLQQALTTLISDTTALRTLVSLDGAHLIEDDALVGHCGALFVALADVCCVLAVNVGQAMSRGADDADARLQAQLARFAERRAAVQQGTG